MHKVLIGVGTHNDLHYLKESLPVVEQLRQSLPADVAILDSAWNDEVKAFIEKEFPDFHYLRHEDGNIGYGRTFSEILKAFPGHKYFLLCTNDVFLDVPTVKQFVQRMEKDPSLTMAAGKLHCWDLETGHRSNRIDSLGILADKKHHFYERGSGEEDRGQYDEQLNDFFGLSGAAFLIRTNVIPQLHGSDWQLFDERMWMYKEDVDLAYRLRWLGEKIVLFPEVWGWHARTVSNREGQGLKNLHKAHRKKPERGLFHSYKNHLLLLKNHLTLAYGLGVFLRVFFFEFGKAIYMLFSSPKTFFAGLKTLFFVKGRRSNRKLSAKEMLSYFQ